MRSELGKECRKLFREMMVTEFPEYREDKGQIVPHGRTVWTRQHSSGLWFHILLLIHHSWDQFTIETAWDFDGKLPGLSSPDDVLVRPLLFRPNWLWSRKDYWWPLVLQPEEYERSRLGYIEDPIERCLPLVAPAVSDAAKKLKEHLIPVFEKIAEKHGNGTNSKGGSQQLHEQA